MALPLAKPFQQTMPAEMMGANDLETK